MLLSTAVLSSFLTSVLAVRASIETSVDVATVSMPDLVVMPMMAGRVTLLAPQDIDRAETLPDSARVAPRVWGYVYYAPMRENIVVFGTSVVFGNSVGVDSVSSPGDPNRTPIDIGSHIAHSLGLRVGDLMLLPARPRPITCRVARILRSPTLADHVLAPVATARNILGVPEDHFVDLAIDVFPDPEIDIVRQEVSALLPNARIASRADVRARLFDTLGRRSAWLLGIAGPALFALFLLVGSAWFIHDRKDSQLFLVMVSMGHPPSTARAVLVWETAIVASLGNILGGLLGLFYVHGLGAPWLRLSLLGWGGLPSSLPWALPLSDLLIVLGAITTLMVTLSLLRWTRVSSAPMSQLLRGLK